MFAQNIYTLFCIRTSKLCRGSSFFIFFAGRFQHQIVRNLLLYLRTLWSEEKKQKKNLLFGQWFYNKWGTTHNFESLQTHLFHIELAKVWLLIHIELQPGLKLSFNCDQFEPRCSYIKRACTSSNFTKLGNKNTSACLKTRAALVYRLKTVITIFFNRR